MEKAYAMLEVLSSEIKDLSTNVLSNEKNIHLGSPDRSQNYWHFST